MKLERYPEYKDSGLLWLDTVPAHWNILRTKYVFREVDERSKTGLEPHLSMSQKYGLVKSSKIEDWRLQSESYVGGKLCKTNDLVLNRLKAHLGVFARAPQDGIVSPDYTVFRLVQGDEVRFFELVFKTPNCIAELYRSTKGIVEGFWRLYTDDFYNIRIPVPSQPEQCIILAWIDQFDGQIRRFIRSKRRLIELLKEQKQAIINQAVTCGIDPNVRLKPSGFEWLGDIPEHWELLPLRRVTKFVKTGGTPSGAAERFFSPEGMAWYTPSDFKDGLFLDQSERRLSPLGVVNVKTFPENTVMMIGIGGTIGKVAISRVVSSCNQQINAIQVNDRIIAQYLALYLRSLRGFIIACGKYTTLPIINQEETKALQVIVPSRKEQQTIVDYINSESELITVTISRTEREIELMGEYRTRLIADVVTGKVDVRDVPVEVVPQDWEEVEETAEAEEMEEWVEDGEIQDADE